jgi:hypothetical protein
VRLWDAQVSSGKCDFCSSLEPVVLYPCQDFVFAAITEGQVFEHPSEGGWAACITCQLLIELERWDDLIDRAIEQQGGLPPGANVALARDYMRAWIIEGFRDHREGDPIPFVE